MEAIDEPTLEARLYPSVMTTPGRTLPDPVYLANELRRPGVTLRLVHAEYTEQGPGGYGYTQFCEAFRAWQKRRKPTMRQLHRAGDKAFIDYSGKKPSVVDPGTGERVEVELFVAVLGASSSATTSGVERPVEFFSLGEANGHSGLQPGQRINVQLRSAEGAERPTPVVS